MATPPMLPRRRPGRRAVHGPPAAGPRGGFR